jgi:hypothetical protein
VLVEEAGTKAREGSVAEDWEEEAKDGSPSMEDDIVSLGGCGKDGGSLLQTFTFPQC